MANSNSPTSYFQFINWLVHDGKSRTRVVKLLVTCFFFSVEKSTLSPQLNWKIYLLTCFLHWIIQKLSIKLKCAPLPYLISDLVWSSLIWPCRLLSLCLYFHHRFSAYFFSQVHGFSCKYMTWNATHCSSLSSPLKYIMLVLPRFWHKIFNIKCIVRKN